jgi:hypothetical protein
MKHYLAVIVVGDASNHIGTSYNKWVISTPQLFIHNVDLWKKYMNSDEEILCLFAQADENLDTDYILDLENNLLRVKSGHSYLGNEYLIKQFKIVDSMISYDYIISATSSSFWVFPKLKHELIHNTPKTGVYKGRCFYQLRVPYVSGSGIIMTKDVCQILINNSNYLNSEYHSHPEDFAYCNDAIFGYCLYQNGITPISTNWWYDFDNNKLEYLYERIKETEGRNTIQYRIKNTADRLYYDTRIMNTLYNHYYVTPYISSVDVPQGESPKIIYNKPISWLRIK